MNKQLLFLCWLVFAHTLVGQAQERWMKGTVYEQTKRFPLIGVTVQTTGGQVALSDSSGRYKIKVSSGDSLWFSYLGKPTQKYPIAPMMGWTQFDIALGVTVKMLPEVFVKRKSYREDSLANRREYEKVFAYRKPNYNSLITTGTSDAPGAGLDINEVIRLFQFRRNKLMIGFRERLEREEQDKYVEYRFNNRIIKQLTDITEEELPAFKKEFKPSYAFSANSSDVDFYMYIQAAAKRFRLAHPKQ